MEAHCSFPKFRYFNCLISNFVTYIQLIEEKLSVVFSFTSVQVSNFHVVGDYNTLLMDTYGPVQAV